MTETCLVCGRELTETEKAAGTTCTSCGTGAAGASQSAWGLRPGEGWGASRGQSPLGAIGGGPPEAPGGQPRSNEPGESANFAPYGAYQQLEQPDTASYNPDRPPWGFGAAICVWLASVAAIVILPNFAFVVWLLYERSRGLVIPADPEQAEKLLAQPRVALIVVLSTVVAHLITLLIIWAVITGLGRRSALRAPEWKWLGPSPAAKFLFVVGVVFLLFVVEVGVGTLVPQSKETAFEKLVKNAGNVRILIAFLAVFTAPLVEEWVYRGVLYGGLRRIAATWPSILVVALLFAGVHFPQYWGAWAGLISITFLSLTLTIIRAKTNSILPCIAVHILFNAITSVVILTHHY